MKFSILSKKKTLSCLNKWQNKIERMDSTSIDKIIHSHYTQLFKIYNKNKLFYKTIFKCNRFLLGATIISEYYLLKEPTLSGVTNRSLSLKIMSKNSVSHFFSFLVFTSRLILNRSSKDLRKLTFSLSPKLTKETHLMIDSMVGPLTEKFNIPHLNNMDDDEYLSFFFEGFCNILHYNLFNFNDIENVEIFIDKDAGHSIILCLFVNKMHLENGTYQTISVKDLSCKCGVSRTHVKKILMTAYEKGFVLSPGSENHIIITEHFCNFVRKYMIKYFALCIAGVLLPGNYEY